MPSLSQAKTLGGVGSILVLLAFLPVVGWILAIVGLILTLIAVKYISDVLTDKVIFNNMLISVILGIVGIGVAGIFVVGSVMRFIGMGSLYNSAITSQPLNPSSLPPSDIMGMVGGILVGLVALWVFFIVSAFFLRKAYDSVGTKLRVGMFGTAALIYLIGAALTIVIIGFVLLFVAQILFIVAFFSIPDKAETSAPMPGSPPNP